LAIPCEWGVQGLWLGYAFGLTIVFVLYAITYCLTDWNEVLKLVRLQMLIKDEELRRITSQGQCEEEEETASAREASESGNSQN